MILASLQTALISARRWIGPADNLKGASLPSVDLTDPYGEKVVPSTSYSCKVPVHESRTTNFDNQSEAILDMRVKKRTLETLI